MLSVLFCNSCTQIFEWVKGFHTRPETDQTVGSQKGRTLTPHITDVADGMS